jgi:hypothetical protein
VDDSRISVWSCLVHLVKNLVAHGVEREDERRARGKAPSGRVSFRPSMPDAASGSRRFRKVVEGLGGKVVVRSRRGEGTEVTATVPGNGVFRVAMPSTVN